MIDIKKLFDELCAEDLRGIEGGNSTERLISFSNLLLSFATFEETAEHAGIIGKEYENLFKKIFKIYQDQHDSEFHRRRFSPFPVSGPQGIANLTRDAITRKKLMAFVSQMKSGGGSEDDLRYADYLMQSQELKKSGNIYEEESKLFLTSRMNDRDVKVFEKLLTEYKVAEGAEPKVNGRYSPNFIYFMEECVKLGGFNVQVQRGPF
ncbi:MAG: hypothetical protein V4568_15090 [Pseudomonadota bacterium]